MYQIYECSIREYRSIFLFMFFIAADKLIFIETINYISKFNTISKNYRDIDNFSIYRTSLVLREKLELAVIV